MRPLTALVFGVVVAATDADADADADAEIEEKSLRIIRCPS